MQDLMRKHKRAILVFIILFMAIPFVFFFGMPSGKGSHQQEFKDDVVAEVGNVPVYASEFRRFLDMTAQRQARGGERPTYRQMDEDGTASRILQQMVDSALITVQEQRRNFDVNKSLLQDKMKDWDQFKDESGNFNPEAWNAWVKERKGQDWNEIYADLKKGVSREVFIDTITAPSGRVLDKDIDKQLEKNSTKLRIKYAKIEPPVTPTEEQIQAQYNENPDTYKTPDQWVAELVAVSLQPEVPQKALDLVKQAREGADFIALADQNSDLKSANGGDMGWQSEREQEIEYRKPLFTLAVGQVSDPVYAFNSYFIYKVEEERTNEETQKREVHARQIMIKAELPEEERAKRDDIAQKISEKAKETKDLQAAAAEAGLSVQRTNAFTKESIEIDNVARNDVSAVRMAFENRAEDSDFDVISGRANLYVTKLVEKTPGVVPPLEEVREKVVENTISKLKSEEEYRNKVKELADKIKAQVKSIDEIAQAFPDLGVEVKESSEFTAKDYFLQKDKVYLQAAQIYDVVGEGEPGIMGGPLTDFMGVTYFVSLIERTAPTEEDKKGWDEERKKLRDTSVASAENQLVEDYLADLRERLGSSIKIVPNESVIADILGRNQPEEKADTADEAAPLPQSAPVTTGLEGLKEDE